MKLEKLDLSEKVYAALIRAGYKTIESVAKTDGRDLLAIRNFGPNSFNELFAALEAHWEK